MERYAGSPGGQRSSAVDVGLHFEDIPPDQKITILAEAHRYGVQHTGIRIQL